MGVHTFRYLDLVVKNATAPAFILTEKGRVTLVFQVKLSRWLSALSLSLHPGDSDCQKWAWAALIITSMRIPVSDSNVVAQFLLLLKSSVTLTIMSSLMHKSNSAPTNLCLCPLECWLADWVMFEFVLRSVRSFVFQILPYSLSSTLSGVYRFKTLHLRETRNVKKNKKLHPNWGHWKRLGKLGCLFYSLLKLCLSLQSSL